MPEYAQTLTYLFAVLTVLLEIVLVMVIVSRLAMKRWLPLTFMRVVQRLGLRAAALFGVSGVLLSLWYPEIVGLPVCPLCWFARTMMYPLAVILVVAMLRKDYTVWHYALPLSVIGLAITGYHHLYQIGLVKGTLCTALSDGGECATRYVFEFDFVTMPLMGFTLFGCVALLTWLVRR